MTLVEVLLAVVILTVVFGGLFTGFQAMVALIGSSKAQAGALSLANQKLEYIRSLPYNSVGTVGGIPSGLIPQISSVTLNATVYSERILVEYIDDPHDGTGASDSNGILTDYKLVKIEYSWVDKAQTKNISLISNIVPKGIETNAGGGTLIVNVFDADVLPLSGAAVRVYNNNPGTTTVDTTRYTDVNGIAMFAGAPARANYNITVTDTGFSTDQTYAASSTNPNPITPLVAVLKSTVSTMNFQIDELSDLRVKTKGLPTTGSFKDLFDDSSLVSTTTQITIAGGDAKLQGAPGSYSSNGTLYSTAITPGTLASWDTIYYQATKPANTDILVRVYNRTGTTTPTLIPDTDLPGNSAGFAPGSMNITSLNVGTYQSLALGATLTSSNTATTSTLFEWGVTYTVSQSVLASIPFTLTSTKKIGTDASAQPVYKYVKSFTTNGSGENAITNLEWDVYTVQVTDASYDVAEACNDIPYTLDPGVDESLTLTLAAATANSLRVRVVDSSGDEVPNATVDLTRSGYSDSKETSVCGQAFFNSSVPSATDFTLSVHAYGYVDQSATNVSVSGDQVVTVTLVGS